VIEVSPPKMAVPILDLSRFMNGSAIEEQEFAHDLLNGFTGSGFVKLVNHGISDKTIQKLFSFVGILNS
jgi:isopenicillin N synthase-like dioxygenase